MEIKMIEYGVVIKGMSGYAKIEAYNKENALDYISRKLKVPKEDITLIG